MGFINKRSQGVRSADNLQHVKDVVRDFLLNSTIQQVDRIPGFGPEANPAVSHHTRADVRGAPVSFLFDFLHEGDRKGYLVGIEGLSSTANTEAAKLVRHFVHDTQHLSADLDSVPDLFEAMVKALLQIQREEHKDSSSDDYVSDIVERLELARTLPSGRQVIRTVTVIHPAELEDDSAQEPEKTDDQEAAVADDHGKTQTASTEGATETTENMGNTDDNDDIGGADKSTEEASEERNNTMSIKETAEDLKNRLKGGVEDAKDNFGGDDDNQRDEHQDHSEDFDRQDTSDTLTGDRNEDDLTTTTVPPGDNLDSDPLREDPVGTGVVDAPPNSADSPLSEPVVPEDGSTLESPSNDYNDDRWGNEGGVGADGPFPGDLPSDTPEVHSNATDRALGDHDTFLDDSAESTVSGRVDTSEADGDGVYDRTTTTP